MKYVTDEVKNIGILLKEDSENTPMGKYLNPKKLDFSLKSLNYVDDYLEKVRKNKKKLTDEEINKVIIRCGTYLGEVIRKEKPKKFNWITYDEAHKLSKEFMQMIGKNITTHFILYDNHNFSFPLGKAYKFLEYGRSDSLWGFAKLCLEDFK